VLQTLFSFTTLSSKPIYHNTHHHHILTTTPTITMQLTNIFLGLVATAIAVPHAATLTSHEVEVGKAFQAVGFTGPSIALTEGRCTVVK